MPLREVLVVGDTQSLPKGLLKKALVKIDAMSYFSSDSAVVAKLENTGWIRSVKVKRQYPGRWWLFFTVRKPIMQVVDAQRMLDEDGTLMRVKPEKCHVSLPKVYAPDEQIKQVYMFWKSISSYNHAWLQRLRVVRYHQHSGWELEFNGNIKLKLGFVALSKRLQRFLLVADKWHSYADASNQVFDFRYKNAFSHKKNSG